MDALQAGLEARGIPCYRVRYRDDDRLYYLRDGRLYLATAAPGRIVVKEVEHGEIS